MSDKDIKTRIEEILSDILSDKYEAEIKIKFVGKKEITVNGDIDTSGDITEK